jgi:hypothetical protein
MKSGATRFCWADSKPPLRSLDFPAALRGAPPMAGGTAPPKLRGSDKRVRLWLDLSAVEADAVATATLGVI